MKAIQSLTLAVIALLFAAVPAHAASPKIGCAVEVGVPASGGTLRPVVFLKFLDSAMPGPAYRIYWKVGAPDAAGSYSLLSTIQQTSDPVMLGHLLERASDAGVSLVTLEAQLSVIIGAGKMPGASLAERLAFVVQATSESGVIEFQREALSNSHPAMAAALGRAYFAEVPEGVSTFEVRDFDPGTGTEGAVVGRATTGGGIEYLPAPDGLRELAETRPQGHLRVQLQWCAPLALRQRFLHWRGAAVFRASRQHWINQFGAAPPLAISRDTLRDAVAAGDIVTVNSQPVMPEVVPPDPLDPLFDVPMFTDDNDSTTETQVGGAPKFVAGDRYVYWVAETDLLGRPGHPAKGVAVTICDRLAPDPPRGLTVTNVRKFAGGAAEDFLRLEWPTAPATEVRRWYLYLSDEFDDALAEYAANPKNPITPSLLATIPNDGTFAVDGRIRFDHDSSAALPMPALGETVFYRLRAEDDAPCKDVFDRGNISGLSGPVPAARHDLMGPVSVDGRLVRPCCEIDVSYTPATGNPLRRFTAQLRGVRPAGSRFHWVEFRDITNNRFIGRYSFAPGQDAVTAEYQPGNSSSPVFSARFGHHGGYVSGWRNSFSPDSVPYDLHRFQPYWICQDRVPSDQCPGPHLPQDPEDGSPHDVCLILDLDADIKSWVAYVQMGAAGKKTKFASGNVNAAGPVEVCFSAFPPRGGELCFYAQGFDAGGNPGPMELIGCVSVAPKDGLPVPSVTRGSPATAAFPTADINAFVLHWTCPPGAERFDVAFTPPPPNAEQTFLEADSSGALREWGTLQTLRVATAFGDNAPEFAGAFTLVKGVNYRAKTRAVTGTGDDRDEGAWSLPFALHWLNQPVVAGQVPWPMRDSPGITGAAQMAWDGPESILRVRIGEMPGNLTTILPVDSLEPYLYYDLPVVVWLRETGAGAEGRMLQVTHRIDQLLTIPAGNNGLSITDGSVKIITPGGGAPREIWLRLDQGVLSGKTYEAFLVFHDSSGEIKEVRMTNQTAVPGL